MSNKEISEKIFEEYGMSFAHLFKICEGVPTFTEGAPR